MKLLAECQDVQEVNELQDAHARTFEAVNNTKPHITDCIKDQFNKRRSMLAQKPN